MASSLSNLVVNIREGIHNIKFKDCDCYYEYKSVKDNLLTFRCLSSNKDYSNKLDEKLKNHLRTDLKFSNHAIDKFILLLTEGVYP